MTITAKALLGVLIAMTLIGTWMGRYDIDGTATPSGSFALLDRWTGKAWHCNALGCAALYPSR